MQRQFTVVCDDRLGRRVAALARKYDTTEEEVARQLIEYGIECLD
ncbi:CopG family transcriptional regulator [Halanaeroarchaeum sp. HSR-CO]|nr:CopG family transcriptional regulator [Halanaeroarchaeum sp. HSR-CO]UWG46548.1 CopG family transcriptional regulator [Halanaeroarchaeum sp. HSR-CO]